MTCTESVDSNEALSYIWFIWRFIGIYPPSTAHPRLRLLYRIYSYLIIVLCFICLPVTLLAQLFFIDNVKDLIENLSVSTSFVISTCKYFVIYVYRDNLLQVRGYLTKLNARCNDNAADQQLIQRAVRLCHQIAVAYILCYNFVGSGYAYVGYQAQRLMYSGWFPNIFAHNAKANYLLAFWYQFVAQTFAIFQNASNDMYPPSHLVVMIAQLRALSARIARIGAEPRKNADYHLAALLSCIQDHKLILEYFECIRKPISRTIFFQFLIMAFVLCLNAINFLLFDRDITQILFTGSYLFAIVIEVFPCCWFLNELMMENDLLTTAMYNCLWYEQDQRFRKTLIIFMQRSQKKIVIMAGNLAPVTLQTFTAVIRISFSLFTIMSEINV